MSKKILTFFLFAFACSSFANSSYMHESMNDLDNTIFYCTNIDQLLDEGFLVQNNNGWSCAENEGCEKDVYQLVVRKNISELTKSPNRAEIEVTRWKENKTVLKNSSWDFESHVSTSLFWMVDNNYSISINFAHSSVKHSGEISTFDEENVDDWNDGWSNFLEFTCYKPEDKL